MKKPVIWLLYLFVLVLITLPQGMHTHLTGLTACITETGEEKPGCYYQPLTPSATNADIIQLFQASDAAFIAKLAKKIVETRDWGHISAWPLWPPGMIALETFLYWLSPNIPVALVFIILSCLLWASVFTLLADILMASGVNKPCAFALPLLFLLTQGFVYFLHVGLFYSESYSIAFFLLGAGWMIRMDIPPCRKAIVAGILFALSAYMRAQTDIIMSSATLLFLFCAAWNWRAIKEAFVLRNSTGWLATAGFCLLAYHGLTLPYRAAHGMHWIGFFENPMWHAVWIREDHITPLLQFYKDGGALAGCHVDPDLCQHIHLREERGDALTHHDYCMWAIQSFLHYPLRWIMFKLPYLVKFWFSGYVESMLITLALGFSLWRLAVERSPQNTLLLFLFLSTLCGVLLPLFLIHIEPRYLYQIKLFILYIAIILSGTFLRQTGCQMIKHFLKRGVPQP